MDLHLVGKVALVTGGAAGLGKAVALGLAAEGAKVAVNDYARAREAEATVDEIRKTHGVDALAVRADVGSEAEVEAMFGTVLQRFGRLDILVNNAALCP